MAQPRRMADRRSTAAAVGHLRSEEHTSELQSHSDLVCRLLLEKKKKCASEPATSKHSRASSVRSSSALACSFSTLRGFSRSSSSAAMSSFFFNDAATTEIYTLSLHDALPI